MLDERLTKVRFAFDSSVGDEQRTLVRNAFATVGAVEGDIGSAGGKVTHLLTLTPHISVPDAVRTRVEDGEIAVCTPAWALKSAMVLLQDPIYFSPDPAMIFSGVCVLCSPEIPPGDREVIYGAVHALGGQHRSSPVKDVTHVICLKVDQIPGHLMQATKLGIKFVAPTWIDECMRLQRHVSTAPHEFISPDSIPLVYQANHLLQASPSAERVLQQTIKAAQQAIDHKSVEGQEKVSLFKTSVDGYGPGDAFANQVAQVFGGKEICLSATLPIGQPVRNMLERLIRQAGGAVATTNDHDILITKWREGEDYLMAAAHRKTIASVEWLYHVIRIGRLSSPLDELFHYPIPRGKVPGFENMSMTVTNYTGGPRDYLKKLISTMGAQFTTTMSASTTHLIAATKIGEKARRSEEWGIICVNHLWLEECFRAWAAISPTGMDERFVDFRLSANNIALVGYAGLTEASLLRWTQPDATSIAPEGSMSQTSPVKPRSTRPTQSATLIGTAAPASSVRKPEIATPRNGSTATIKVKHDSGSASGTPTVKRRRLDSVDVNIRTPSSRGVATENILSVGSKRKAATAASEKLYEDVMDANKYAKERKRKDIVSPKSRRAAMLPIPVDGDENEDMEDRDDQPEVKQSARKIGTQSARKLQAVTDMQPSSRSNGKTSAAARQRARSRTTASVSVEPNADIKLSSVEKVKWTTTGVNLSEQETKAMKKLGGRPATHPTVCTHLICEKVSRTPKFLLAFPHAPIIVKSAWVAACIAAQAFVDEGPYLLSDPENEEKYGMTLQSSLARARELYDEGGLFDGMHFATTEHAEESFDTLKEVVKEAGGELARFTKAKEKQLLSSQAMWYLISCQQDKPIWEPLQARGVPVYTRELYLKGLIRMRLDLKECLLT